MSSRLKQWQKSKSEIHKKASRNSNCQVKQLAVIDAGLQLIKNINSQITQSKNEVAIDRLNRSNKVHPLQNIWTLWFLENEEQRKSWHDKQMEIVSISTVEEFWGVFAHVKPPSKLGPSHDYSLFKKGVRPMWEDEANKCGGRWLIAVHRNAGEKMDCLWLDVLMCLTGEAFDHTDQICGAVVNVRSKLNKISLWTRDAANEKAILEIGNKLRQCLGLPQKNLQYQSFKETVIMKSSIAPLYIL